MIGKLKYRIRNSLLVLTRDAAPFWLTVSVLLFGLLLPQFWAGDSETASRHSGILLQTAGLVLVGIGIEDTRRRFKRPTIIKAFKEWLGKLKNAILLPPISGSSDATVTLGTVASGWTGYPPTVTTSTEERLRAAEKAVDELQKGLSRIVGDISDLRKSLADEATARQRSDSEVRSLVEEQSAGGLHWEVIGLVWLLFGTLVGW
jgi:hypothetical protein